MKRTQIIGNVVRDAEVKVLPTGKKAINFTVAVNVKKKNSSGQYEDHASFFKCVYWRDADSDTKVVDYLKKGAKVYAEGDPDLEVYTTQDNKPAANIKIHVKYLDIVKLANGTSGQATDSATSRASQTGSSAAANDNDDLPF